MSHHPRHLRPPRRLNPDAPRDAVHTFPVQRSLIRPLRLRPATRERPLRAAIRDDDTCFFTTPEALERVYGRYWDRIPISLAVVPVHASTRSKGIPPEHWEGEREFPLGENQ